MIELLEKLVSFKTINCDDELPFGSENKKCLNYMLDLAKKDGFKVKNLDNYCGYIEIGEGKELIGIVAHLDVVPAKNDEDFIMKRVGNTLYGRGVSDDKGAVCASYYALKELKNMKLNKRVRLILGCNEETGSNCMKHYNEVEEPLTYGFTPDGDFPVINGEKGMIRGVFNGISTNIINIKGGIVSNAVSDYCMCELKEELNSNLLDNYFKSNNIKYKYENNKLEVFGKSAHASTPELGVNAINHLLTGLHYANYKDEFVDFFYKYFKCDMHGESLGIDFEDEYSRTTLNIGLISINNGIIEGTIDIRYPVTKTYNELLIKLPENIKFLNHVEPLFYDKESNLVKTLLNTYNDIMHTNLEPLVIGGGTYAKEMNNTVAFGCAFPDIDYHIHDEGEFVRIEELELQKELYKEAVIRLTNI